jgi:hypothetical protein
MNATTNHDHWQVLARHPWTYGATITESMNADDTRRRFTATIRGYRNWKIAITDTAHVTPTVRLIVAIVEGIRDRIDAGDESIYSEPNEYREVTA